jgi:hypothetical protein
MRWRSPVYWNLLVFIASFGLFGTMVIGLSVPTDIQWHAYHIQQALVGSLPPPANFLYYLAVYAFALFSTEPALLYLSSTLVLALSVTAKFHITRAFFLRHLRVLGHELEFSDRGIRFFSLSLLVVFSLPAGHFYLGQIPPNVWHSSTTIFVMPFALLLFLLSYDQLIQPTSRRLLAITVLILLNVTAKPSFFFVLASVYPFFLLGRFGLKRTFWVNLLPVLLGVIVTGLLYYLIYVLEFTILISEGSGLEIRPFAAWSRLSSHIPLSLLCSLFFPVTFLAVFRPGLGKHLLLEYAVSAYLVALGMFVLLAETGPRADHGNFIWQAVICAYILFAVTGVLFSTKIRQLGMRDWRIKVSGLAWSAHLLAGILYIGKMLFTRSYY